MTKKRSWLLPCRDVVRHHRLDSTELSNTLDEPAADQPRSMNPPSPAPAPLPLGLCKDRSGG